MKTRSAASLVLSVAASSHKKKVAAASVAVMAKKNKISARSKTSKTKVDGPWFSVFTKGDAEYEEYMTKEWGFETRGDQPLFEKITLEGAQSGLSWLTILRKREAYRRVFHQFDIDKVAAMTPDDVDRILNEEDKKNTQNIIVRHRGKVESTINNAKCIQQMRRDAGGGDMTKHGVLDDFLWSFVDDKPILNVSWKGGGGEGDSVLKNAPTQSPESKAMSKALKELGFRFVGPTTCYAMMQSVGMVLDHPKGSDEWKAAYQRLQAREGGYQQR
eukprot:scaffold5347_cov130-Cylindrotheca_fusiformis.AAC.7